MDIMRFGISGLRILQEDWVTYRGFHFQDTYLGRGALLLQVLRCQVIFIFSTILWIWIQFFYYLDTRAHCILFWRQLNNEPPSTCQKVHHLVKPYLWLHLYSSQ